MIIAVLFLFVFPFPVAAEYVLPYPSYMPGNKLYTVSRIIDRLKAFWYWGDIGQFRYHLTLSDKYLVEAKTLFDYKQYLLAANALARSDLQFSQTTVNLSSARDHGKDISVLRQTLLRAETAHESVVRILLTDTPGTFTWTPERKAASYLDIHSMLEHSLRSDQSVASRAASL